VQAAGAPVTEEEARQFADRLSQLVKAGDERAINRLLHVSDLIKRVVSDLGLTEEERQAALEGALRSPDEGRLGAAILRTIADGGSYRFLRVHTVADRRRALFRQIRGDGALVYNDFILTRFPDGIGMEDLYVLSTGELFSQTCRRLLIPLLTERLRGERAKRIKDGYAASLPAIRALTRATEPGEITQAVAQYRRLPQEVRENKTLLLFYIGVLQRHIEAADKDYLEAMETFRKLYPNDAALDILSMGYYILKQRYDEALTAVDRVEKAVGGDPYLNTLRANILAEAGRYDMARVAAEKAIKAEPALEHAYWPRLLVSLREKKYTDTQTWLKKMVEACQVPVDWLADNPEYAGFIKSPQYREWQKWYQAQLKK
jgi:tetratricopeptide (TPR) repeat protein